MVTITHNPVVADMVREYLAAHGYDGLFNADGECACTTDELCPCASDMNGELLCEAGYRVPCDQATCGEHVFHIERKRPPRRSQQHD